MTPRDLDLRVPANAALLAHLSATRRGARATAEGAPVESCPPDAVADPRMRLGTHPDVVERLWDELGGALPLPCQWVAWGAPALVHPRTGVVFAFAGGTVYALRLLGTDVAEALRAGAEQVHDFPAYPALGIAASSLDLRTIGPEWVFGGWRREEPAWCHAAFEAAGALR